MENEKIIIIQVQASGYNQNNDLFANASERPTDDTNFLQENVIKHVEINHDNNRTN